MADLTKGSGKEVALVQLADGRHIMILGDASSVSTRGLETAWGVKPISILGHTHPSGELYLSHGLQEVRPGVFQAIGDVPVLQRLGQQVSAVIGPNGMYRILNIADFGG